MGFMHHVEIDKKNQLDFSVWLVCLACRETSEHRETDLHLYVYILIEYLTLCLFFGKSLFKFFYKFLCVCLTIENWSMKNTFKLKKNLAWFPEKCFPVIFERKTLSGSCEKFRNIILFADYIKFGPPTFDCYIYFVLNIYFSISSLKI